jgi:hypothetical protein
MRGQAWFVAALLVASAGCVGGEDGSSMGTTGGEKAPLPSPVHDERHVETGANPVGSAQEQSCQAEGSSCYRYPFQVDTDARVQANLDWANATNDFDLHVLDGEGQQVASATTGPLDTRESLDAALAPGGYELVVVAWLATSDTYALEAHFGYT